MSKSGTKNAANSALIRFIISMVVFGTIGIFRRYIPLDSGLIAQTRGLVGGLYIIVFLAITGRPFSFKHFDTKSLVLLIFSGAIMGFNWITLFEAYNFTSVSVATLAYYMQPIFLILISPVVFKERLKLKKVLCVVVALIGMVFISGVIGSKDGLGDMRGLALGVISALLYAFVVTISKMVGSSVDPYEKTALQLLTASVSVTPYLIIKGVFANPSALVASLTPLTIIMLLIVCIGHTGITYTMYFGSLDKLRVQQVAVFSYIDPVVAIILSQIILGENMGITGIIGAVLILGAAFVSEVFL